MSFLGGDKKHKQTFHTDISWRQ